jgi:hypothetical protein
MLIPPGEVQLSMGDNKEKADRRISAAGFFVLLFRSFFVGAFFLVLLAPRRFFLAGAASSAVSSSSSSFSSSSAACFSNLFRFFSSVARAASRASCFSASPALTSYRTALVHYGRFVGLSFATLSTFNRFCTLTSSRFRRTPLYMLCSFARNSAG